MTSPSSGVGPITLTLPEPPSLNVMIDMAKQRVAVRGRGLPIVYDRNKDRYGLLCTKAMRESGVKPPRDPWPRWEMTAAHFRLHNLRDPFELLAGLKWVVDWLVESGFATNDSPREVPSIPKPTQEIARQSRGITITIRPL